MYIGRGGNQIGSVSIREEIPVCIPTGTGWVKFFYTYSMRRGGGGYHDHVKHNGRNDNPDIGMDQERDYGGLRFCMKSLDLLGD